MRTEIISMYGYIDKNTLIRCLLKKGITMKTIASQLVSNLKLITLSIERGGSYTCDQGGRGSSYSCNAGLFGNMNISQLDNQSLEGADTFSLVLNGINE